MNVFDDIDKIKLRHLELMGAEGMLRELLARIHGDGGHHTERVGLAQSVLDAMNRERWSK